MPYPTVVGVGSTASGTGDITPGLPSGWAVDDIHILSVATANEAVTAPSGWTETTGSPQGTGTAGATNATRITTFWRRAESGDTDPTITDPGDHCAAVILGLRGCASSGDPWDAAAGRLEAVAVTTATYSAVTTTFDECLIVYISAFDYEVTGTENVSIVNAALASITDRSVQAYADGNGSSLAVITGEKATAGSIGSGTITWRSGLTPQSGLHGLITLSFPGVKTGSVTATLANLTYTITGTLPIVGELFQALANLSTTIEGELETFGTLAKTLADVTLEGTGYSVTIAGTLSRTLDDLDTVVAGIATGLHGTYGVGAVNATLADVTIVSTGERQGTGSYDFPLSNLSLDSIGLISLTRDGSVTATLENVSPEGTGGVGFGAVLAAGLRPGNLQNLEWYITGQTETHGSVIVTLDGLVTGITGTGTDNATYTTGNNPGGPGVLGNRSDGLIWEAPVSQWQSLCANTLQPRLGNPIAGCVICVNPVDV